MPHPATVPELIEAGLGRSTAYAVMAGNRDVSVPVALWLLDEHGLVVPALEGKSKREIDALRGMFEPAPPSPAHKEGAQRAAALRRARAA